MIFAPPEFVLGERALTPPFFLFLTNDPFSQADVGIRGGYPLPGLPVSEITIVGYDGSGVIESVGSEGSFFSPLKHFRPFSAFIAHLIPLHPLLILQEPILT